MIDIDADGTLDLVSGGLAPQLFRYVAPGSYAGGPSQLGAQELYRAVGDLDGDGDDDVVTGGTTGMHLHWQGINGQFTLDASAISTPTSIIVRPYLFDCDGDGDLDVFAESSQPQLFRNDGAGVFTEVTATAITATRTVLEDTAVCDVEPDGDLDLLVMSGTNSNSFQPALWRNDGNGAFTEESIPGVFHVLYTATISAVDLDGDGLQDLVCTGPVLSHASWLNDGAGGFQSVVTGPLPGAATFEDHYRWVDWDQDGRTDLVTLNGYWTISPGLQFVAHPFDLPPQSPDRLLAVTDLDGDLDLDIVGLDRVLWHTTAGVVNTSASRFSGTTFLVGAESRVIAPRTGDVLATTVVATNGLHSDASDPASPLDRVYIRRPYAQLPFPTEVAPLAQALVEGADACVGCIFGMPKLFRLSGGQLVEEPTAVFPAGNLTHVAAADLLGVGVDLLVFGGRMTNGPVFGVPSATLPHTWSGVSLPLPPASPSNAQVREDVHVADMDGDGDLDLVHELRVLSQSPTGLTVVADFAPLVSPSARELQTFDFDSDGDRDVLIRSAASVQLLRNDGTAFVDVTTQLPASASAVDLMSHGDVDADGDEDLLVSHQGQPSRLWRNDGGLFTEIPAVGPPGFLLDGDHDGWPDLVTNTELRSNTHSHLHAPRLALPGAQWDIELRSWRFGAPATLALVAVGVDILAQPPHVPGLGKIYVNPATAVFMTALLNGGTATMPIAIPNTPVVLGTDLVAQAVFVDANRALLSGPLFDRVR